MLLTRSVAMVPCVIIAATAVNSLDYLNEYINVEQSLLVIRAHSLLQIYHALGLLLVMSMMSFLYKYYPLEWHLYTFDSQSSCYEAILLPEPIRTVGCYVNMYTSIYINVGQSLLRICTWDLFE